MEITSGKHLGRSKIASIVLVLSLFTFYISSELSRVQAISDYSYRLHELLYIPMNLGLFLIPIEIAAFIYYGIRFLSDARNRKIHKDRMTLTLLVMSITSVVLFSIYVIFITNIVHTTGVFRNMDKEKEGRHYYVMIEGRRIECSKNEYNLISSDRNYSVTYEWNKLFPITNVVEIYEIQK